LHRFFFSVLIWGSADFEPAGCCTVPYLRPATSPRHILLAASVCSRNLDRAVKTISHSQFSSLLENNKKPSFVVSSSSVNFQTSHIFSPKTINMTGREYFPSPSPLDLLHTACRVSTTTTRLVSLSPHNQTTEDYMD
jgi:hypothetical protein